VGGVGLGGAARSRRTGVRKSGVSSEESDTLGYMPELSRHEIDVVIDALIALGWVTDDDSRDSIEAIRKLRGCSGEDAEDIFENIYITRQLIEATGTGGELRLEGVVPVSLWLWRRRAK
jgi:hypothetical protein